MKVAVISDIHDNLENLLECARICSGENIEAMLCLGDVTNIDTVRAMSQEFPMKIYLVRGNADSFSDEEINFDNIEYLGRIGSINIGEFKVGLCHEPFLISRVLDEQVDLVFYGHTHKPDMEKRINVQIVNPGTLGGVFQKPSFALWDSNTGKLELRVLWL